MGQFDDLTDTQASALNDLVAIAHEAKTDNLTYIVAGSGTEAEISPRNQALDPCWLQIDTGTLFALGQRYLHVTGLPSTKLLTMTPDAYAYVRYAHRRRFGRWCQNLRWDLGHDDTLRSKLLWALGTWIASLLSAYLMDRFFP